MSKVTHPPRLADASLLVIESLNALKTPRRAWAYNPGTRRVDALQILHTIISQALIKA